jgi:hypothetical protein
MLRRSATVLGTGARGLRRGPVVSSFTRKLATFLRVSKTTKINVDTVSYVELVDDRTVILHEQLLAGDYWKNKSNRRHVVTFEGEGVAEKWVEQFPNIKNPSKWPVADYNVRCKALAPRFFD